VELEITPEPSADERAAIISALESRDGSAGAQGSVWRLAGLLENVDSGGEAPRVPPDFGSPRSSPGARRA
jgi:hypothetical protein